MVCIVTSEAVSLLKKAGGEVEVGGVGVTVRKGKPGKFPYLRVIPYQDSIGSLVGKDQTMKVVRELEAKNKG